MLQGHPTLFHTYPPAAAECVLLPPSERATADLTQRGRTNDSSYTWGVFWPHSAAVLAPRTAHAPAPRQHTHALSFPPDASSAQHDGRHRLGLHGVGNAGGGARVAACGARGLRGRTSGNACMPARPCPPMCSALQRMTVLKASALVSSRPAGAPITRATVATSEAAGACHHDVHGSHVKARHDHDEVPAAMCLRCRARLQVHGRRQLGVRGDQAQGTVIVAQGMTSRNERKAQGMSGARNERNRVPQLHECQGLRRDTQSHGRNTTSSRVAWHICMHGTCVGLHGTYDIRERNHNIHGRFTSPSRTRSYTCVVQLHRRLGLPLHGHTPRIDTAALEAFSATALFGAEMAA